MVIIYTVYIVLNYYAIAAASATPTDPQQPPIDVKEQLQTRVVIENVNVTLNLYTGTIVPPTNKLKQTKTVSKGDVDGTVNIIITNFLMEAEHKLLVNRVNSGEQDNVTCANINSMCACLSDLPAAYYEYIIGDGVAIINPDVSKNAGKKTNIMKSYETTNTAKNLNARGSQPERDKNLNKNKVATAMPALLPHPLIC
jgi:hypothetical protein